MKNEVVKFVRLLSTEAIQKANSGHPGMPLGAAPMTVELFCNHMNYNPKNPNWDNRDRFVLSAGHGSMLLYSMLHLMNFGLTMEDIKNFRQLGSLTPGHPEYKHTAGVEITTGPLGQGFANAVGFAMAETHLAAKFNREGFNIVDHYSYVMVGDGCLMEGITSEAASIAGNLGLGKLIVLYDSNNITIEGRTDLTFTENVLGKFDAMGWHTQLVEDGEDMQAIAKAIENAKANTDKPSLIEIKTIIGRGVASLQDTSKVHGAPVGEKGVLELYEALGVSGRTPFTVSDQVYAYTKQLSDSFASKEEEWNELFAGYKEQYPELAREYKQWMDGESVVDERIWSVEGAMATRVASGKILNISFEKNPSLFGGSADLGPSNNTVLTGRKSYSKENYDGENIHFGVREHAMAAIANGLQAHGGIKPYVATFFVFADYLKPAIRMSALMKLPVIYVLSHDSIGVGEDGPTHQPIDQLAMLRAIPNVNIIRPADAKETSAAWQIALESKTTPTVLVLSRQNLPALENSSSEALKGAYVVKKESEYEGHACCGCGKHGHRQEAHEGLQQSHENHMHAHHGHALNSHNSYKNEKGYTKDRFITIIATGSEVYTSVEAAQMLENDGIRTRVVSMPSIEIFEKQSEEYKKSVIATCRKHVFTVEAATTFGWAKYGKHNIGIDVFGASAPADKLFEHFGLSSKTIYEQIKKKLL